MPLLYTAQVSRHYPLESPSHQKHQFLSSCQKGLCPTDVTLLATDEAEEQDQWVGARQRPHLSLRHPACHAKRQPASQRLPKSAPPHMEGALEVAPPRNERVQPTYRCLGLPTLEATPRSEEHTSELQSLMRISYAVFCLKKKNNTKIRLINTSTH